MKKHRKLTINRLPLTKARINFGQVIKKAHAEKEYFILEKDGIPVAGLMDIDEFEDYLETIIEQEDIGFQKQIEEGFEEYQKGRTRTADEFFTSLKMENTDK